MTSIGTGYDLYSTTFSPEGRIFQVEYAGKAVENSGTIVAVRTKDGCVIAVENLTHSKMLEPGALRRVHRVAPHLGMSVAGLLADSRQIVSRARSEARQYKNFYGHAMPTKMLNSRLSSFIQFYTLHDAARPFGCASIIAGYDDKGPQLYMIESSGVSWGYFGTAIGKAKASAKTELEKLKLDELTAREAAVELAKIIYTVHDSVKDKNFELEMGWICDESAKKFTSVPEDLLEEAKQKAKEHVSEGVLSSDEEMDDA